MKTIAVIFGGRSVEHDVSIVTALASIIKPLELTKKYKVEAVYISKDGKWFNDEKLKNIELFRHGEIENFIRKAAHVHVSFEDGLTLVKSSQFAGRKSYKKIDIVFPAMHGSNGEDGALMGLLEMANIPYVGCDHFASAVAMDKILAKKIAAHDGIPITKMVAFTRFEYEHDPQEITKRINTSLTYPVFVKPARIGSSIGLSKVDSPKQLVNALDVALHYDGRVLVEEAVANLIELTVPVMGNEAPRTAMVEQPILPEDGVFDFDTKYLKQNKGGSKMGGGKQGAQGYSKLPADINDELYARAQATALGVYKALTCEGLARIDLLVDAKKDIIYFNEVNPLPGSLYAHNWRRAGVSNVELVEELANLAEDRWKHRQRLNTTFSTNFLKQVK